jgi:hypothetical protein
VIERIRTQYIPIAVLDEETLILSCRLNFEESATGAGTNLLKVRMLSQGRALGKVAQEGVEYDRANVAVVDGAERVRRRGE